MTTRAPYGSWASPIAAASLVADGHPVSGGRYVGDEIWWLEARPTEEGRLAVRRLPRPRAAATVGSGSTGADTADTADTQPVDVLPAPWNARTRVHEYGGGAWTTTDAGALVFAEYSDQRLYRLDPGSTEPIAITPDGAGYRFGDLNVIGDEVIAIRETHTDGDLARDIVAVALDGSGIRSIVGGSRFLANPRFSPDGTRLAWIAWEHPQMPWDGTELRVGELRDGTVDSWRVLAGSETESVLQPEWHGDDSLTMISDRSGWWNLYRIDLDGQSRALQPLPADFGGAMWQLGARWYVPLDDHRLLCVRTVGTDTLAILDTRTEAGAGAAAGSAESGADAASGPVLTDLPLDPRLTTIALNSVRDGAVLITGGSAGESGGLRELDLASGVLRDIRLNVDRVPEPEYLPEAESRTLGGVPCTVYHPRNPDFEPMPGELPPFVVVVHGGPTSHSQPALNLIFAYFTSRGIGVLDVNYGGSSGFGREWRERLKGQWGIVDVDDTVAAVRGLADEGLADPARIAIRGGSAGGWTVLSCLTSTDVFACGVSYYGVADLAALAADTHDFESRYLDGLVGPLPEAAEVYRARSPLSNLDGLEQPVLLLQGLDDPIVPPAQAERFRDALVEKGILHAYVGYEGESHGFRRAATVIHSIQAELSFYGQVMGFDTPGAPLLPLSGGAAAS